MDEFLLLSSVSDCLEGEDIVGLGKDVNGLFILYVEGMFSKRLTKAL